MAVQQPRSKTKLKLLLAFLFCVVILTMLNFITASGGLNMDNNDEEERPLLIIAVPSVDDHFKDRNRLRQLTKHFPQVLCPFCKNKRDLDPQVHLLFFIGKRPISDATQQKMAEEMARYEDLVFLNITENLNQGKTWAVLNWIYLNTKAHFVMKSDEDSFVNVPALIQRLRHFQQKFPKEYHKLYYGFPWTYDTWEFTSKSAIMVGMGYTMGWDLIEFFSTDQRAWNKTHGAEDVVTHYWLGNRTDVVRIGDRVRFHDPPGHKGPASWSYRCDDVVVHRLKTDELWKEIKEFYFGCCYQILEDPVECRESPKSSSCCGENSTICDRACVTSLRQLEVVEPFTKYYSDEDLDYLQTPSSN